MKLTLTLIPLFFIVILSATALPPGGSGTQADPYQIACLDNLQWLSETSSVWALSYYYIQTADIDASATGTWNSGSGWNYIGSESVEFKGNYDGQGHSVSGLCFDSTTEYYQGMFGVVSNATISNLSVEDVDFQASNCCGGLVGFANGNCIIASCYSSGNIVGMTQLGGVVGLLGYDSEIHTCFSSTNINGTNSLGGLVGKNFGSPISNCYATGGVFGLDSVGGLIGEFVNGDISMCYSIGSVSGNTRVGGLIGYIWYGSTSACFWDTQTSGQNASAGGTGCTTTQMTTQTTYTNAGWDFVGETANGNDDYWVLDGYNNNGYPYLSWQQFTPEIVIASPVLDMGSCYIEDEYYDDMMLIGNIGDGVLAVTNLSFTDGGLGFLVDNIPFEVAPGDSCPLNVHFCVSTTGAFTDTLVISSNDSATPQLYVPVTMICLYDVGDTGMQGYGNEESPLQVEDLTDLRWISEHVNLWNAWFEQTDFIDASETSAWNDGEGWQPIGNDDYPFSGHYDGQGHMIDGLYINRPWNSFQAVFGHLNNGAVIDLGVVNTYVQGSDCCGGLVGSGEYSTISNCCTTGNINGYDVAGGLVGHLTGSNTVMDCYSTCTVSGENRLGGLVGWVADYVSISNCYAAGCVGSASNTGGLIGYNTGGEITNCFWNTETSGQPTSAGGTGCTTAQMQAQSTFTDAGWDFVGETANGTDDYWAMDGYTNSGYPYLSWQGLGAVIGANPTTLVFEAYSGQTADEQNLTLYNHGPGNLTVSQMGFTDGSQGFSISQGTPVGIAALDSLTVTITFAPGAAGSFADTLVITSDACNAETVRIALSGTGIFSAPAVPENLVILVSGDDVQLSWNPVTTSVDGYPITPDGYYVLCSEAAEADDYLVLDFTTGTTYTHSAALQNYTRLFYKVLAVIQTDTMCMPVLDATDGAVRWGELKAQITR